MRRRNERGGTLIEFSLILMLLLTVLFGVIEVGMMILTYTTLATATRAGARYAVVHGADCTGVCGQSSPDPLIGSVGVSNAVKDLTTAAGLVTANLTVTVTYPNGNNSIASPVQVTAAYAYTPIVSFLPLTVTLGSTTQGMICY
jgi:Flp pilus assembly protein TadG